MSSRLMQVNLPLQPGLELIPVNLAASRVWCLVPGVQSQGAAPFTLET